MLARHEVVKTSSPAYGGMSHQGRFITQPGALRFFFEMGSTRLVELRFLSIWGGDGFDDAFKKKIVFLDKQRFRLATGLAVHYAV